MVSSSFKRIKKQLNQIENILILMHSEPDIDAIGSAYALLCWFLKQKKTAWIGIEIPLYERYSFFIDNHKLKQYFIFPEQIKQKKIEWIVVLDTSTLEMLGSLKQYVDFEKTIIIDHHATFTPFGKYFVSMPEKSSASEMIYDLIHKELDKEMAISLYAGIVYDTGHFRYLSTTGSLLRKIAKMLDRFAIPTEWVYYHIFENESIARKKLSALISSTIETALNSEVVISYFPLSFKENLPLEDSDTVDLVSIGHSLKNCVFSIFVKEKKDAVAFSLRSRSDFDVAHLAQKWGGGGHKKAAGIRIPHMTLEEAKTKIIPLLIEEYHQWRKK